jgi:hypothetical protein
VAQDIGPEFKLQYCKKKKKKKKERKKKNPLIPLTHLSPHLKMKRDN